MAAKWYLPKANFEQVTRYILNLDIAVISTLTQTEMRCLLARRRRTMEININFENQVYATFLDDIAQGHLSVFPVGNNLFECATNLIAMLPSHALRTLDALHLAIAHSNGIKHIATADQLFAKAAEALEFEVSYFA